MYNKLKKQNGEKFAQTVRNFHNGILEIPEIDKILRYAGRGADNAQELLPYLMSLLAVNDDVVAPAVPQNPFELLEKAGYDAFYADTLEKQNSIKKYFKPGELLCTFNDSARYKNYHMVHAVKKNVDSILRKDFNGKEKRQDEYGTSVISIQMLKDGGFISIKNRYNHAVAGCDNTFNSNPDNIIAGLSAGLKDHFNVDFIPGSHVPEGFTLMNGQVFKYHTERRNIYYGDNAWAKDGEIHAVNKGAGDGLFDGFLFDNKSKTLKKIDPDLSDSFADDFNRDYGGNPNLSVKNGNLMLKDDVLIGAENSRIKTICLPELTTMGNNCLQYAKALMHLELNNLKNMGNNCLRDAEALMHLELNNLTTMGNNCLQYAYALTHFEANNLTTMRNNCLQSSNALTHFEANNLTTMGDRCLWSANSLTHLELNNLPTMGYGCLRNVPKVTRLKMLARSIVKRSIKRFTLQRKTVPAKPLQM